MNMRNNRVSANEIKKEILSIVKNARNLTPSEIIEGIHEYFPRHTQYELKFLIKEMQKENELINDIIYGGLKVAA